MRPKARSLSAMQARGVGAAGARAAGMIVRQANDHELRKLAAFLEARKLVENEIGAVLVGHGHLPAHVAGRREGANRLNRGLGLKNDVASLVFPSEVAIHEIGRAAALGIAPADGRHHELAVVADRFLVLERRCPR